jgi:hypothetical protein
MTIGSLCSTFHAVDRPAATAKAETASEIAGFNWTWKKMPDEIVAIGAQIS